MQPQDDPRVVADESVEQYRELVTRLGLPIAASISRDVFRLVESDEGLELRLPGEHDRPGVRAIFPVPEARAIGRRIPLCRAFGKRVDSILDLTAGLGGDAYRLAVCGFRVEAVERDPAVFALLESGWRAALNAGRLPGEIVDRLSFRFGNGAERLADVTSPVPGIYLDPMYPPARRASALPKRALQALRGLLGPDEDAAALLARARECGARVVVKRPHHASPLGGGASHSIESKLVRFDVYLNPALMEENAA